MQTKTRNVRNVRDVREVADPSMPAAPGASEASIEALPSQREIVEGYERDRRLRLTGVVAPIFLVLDTLTILFFAAYLVYLLLTDSPQRALVPFIAALVGVSVVLDALYIVAMVAVRRRRVSLSATLTSFATTGTVVMYGIVWYGSHGLDYYTISVLGSLSIGIVIAGVLGDRRAILIVTLVSNAFMLGLLIVGRRSGDLAGSASGEPYLIASSQFLTEWALATLLLSFQASQRRVVRQLGQSEFEVARAKRLDELKDQFISSVNHELRNPVMAVLANIEGLYLTMDRATPERRSQLAKRALDSGLKLRALIQAILDTRRLDQGAGDFTPTAVDVRATIESAALLVDPNEANMVERDLRVTIPAGTFIWGDEIRLQQILTNLLSNAVKYSPPGMPVEVSAAHVREEARSERSSSGRFLRRGTAAREMLEITVRDFGLGVPPAQAEFLFQRFVRLPRDLASKTIGNGLGLYLCRILAEAMGGSLRVESSGVEGEGSAFIVRLPVPLNADPRAT